VTVSVVVRDVETDLGTIDEMVGLETYSKTLPRLLTISSPVIISKLTKLFDEETIDGGETQLKEDEFITVATTLNLPKMQFISKCGSKLEPETVTKVPPFKAPRVGLIDNIDGETT